jgi:hypothetical protein
MRSVMTFPDSWMLLWKRLSIPCLKHSYWWLLWYSVPW